MEIKIQSIHFDATEKLNAFIQKKEEKLQKSYEDVQKYIGRKADKNRKIYNGMLKTYFYQYLGPKPPRKPKKNPKGLVLLTHKV